MLNVAVVLRNNLFNANCVNADNLYLILDLHTKNIACIYLLLYSCAVC